MEKCTSFMEGGGGFQGEPDGDGEWDEEAFYESMNSIDTNGAFDF